ncbi:MAG TPA: FAD/NAD(P)-binding oxidoreductase [Ktedonobacterales bacterium]|nr:FAD/NAD(P)-binding oxidoreductase [Ktedonobacterales bacterium]
MQVQVAIVGGGVGGTLIANRLRHLLHGDSRHETHITVFDATGTHTYQPGWLYVPFERQDPHKLVRPESRLLGQNITLMSNGAGSVRRILPAEKQLVTADGQTHHYDYLVLATGARNAPEDVPGFAEGANHFYGEAASLQLGEKMAHFTGGRIVTGVASVPYRCPPAPLEYTFMLEAALRERGLREKTEIHYVFPINRPFPIQSVADFVAPLLEKRGVEVHTFFNTESIDPERKVVSSLEGEELPYDLLVLAPPHRGQQVIVDSGLGDRDGWIPTDRNTLRVKGHEDANLFAVGDATDLPVSKSGSAAHYEGRVVAETIAAELQHRPIQQQYQGRVACFLETGHGQATFLWFDYEHPPKPPKPRRMWHLEKAALNTFYWQLIPPARI